MALTIYEYEKILTHNLLLRKKMLGEGATILDAARANHAAMAADYRAEWEATGNPIWVWRCIARLEIFTINSMNLFPELQGQEIGKLPDWCRDYLFQSARRIEQMAGGHDFEEPAPKYHGLNLPSERTIKPTEATSRLPAALGFVRRGWNAFDRYLAEDIPREFLLTTELEKMDGRKPSFTLGWLMNAMGWTDERNARRKLAKLKRRAKPAQLD